MCALLVFMEYPSGEIAQTMVDRFDLAPKTAWALTERLEAERRDYEDKTDAVIKSHLAAQAAEFDLAVTMHEED